MNRWMILSLLLASAAQTTPVTMHCGRPLPDPNGDLWVTEADYPVAARRGNMEGSVRVELHISDIGCPTKCLVVESSGHGVLDNETCALMMRRARYKPALDADGRPIASVTTLKFRWSLPK